MGAQPVLVGRSFILSEAAPHLGKITRARFSFVAAADRGGPLDAAWVPENVATRHFEEPACRRRAQRREIPLSCQVPLSKGCGLSSLVASKAHLPLGTAVSVCARVPQWSLHLEEPNGANDLDSQALRQ
jgi:hypothetical protein